MKEKKHKETAAKEADILNTACEDEMEYTVKAKNADGAKDATCANEAAGGDGAGAADNGDATCTADSDNTANADNANAETSPENEIQQLQAEVAELKDKNARLYADFDNFRKRTAKERLELIKTASADVIESLLPVVDDFERALAAELLGAQAAACAASTVLDLEAAKGTAFEGVALIYQKLTKLLTQNGVTTIEVLNQPFDEEWSEAVAQIPTPDGKTKGHVLDVVQKGYKIDEKVIRHAKVVVGI